MCCLFVFSGLSLKAADLLAREFSLARSVELAVARFAWYAWGLQMLLSSVVLLSLFVRLLGISCSGTALHVSVRNR